MTIRLRRRFATATATARPSARSTSLGFAGLELGRRRRRRRRRQRFPCVECALPVYTDTTYSYLRYLLDAQRSLIRAIWQREYQQRYSKALLALIPRSPRRRLAVPEPTPFPFPPLSALLACNPGMTSTSPGLPVFVVRLHLDGRRRRHGQKTAGSDQWTTGSVRACT